MAWKGTPNNEKPAIIMQEPGKNVRKTEKNPSMHPMYWAMPYWKD